MASNKPKTVATKRQVTGGESKTFGAPTKYREEYCDMLIQHMSKGSSFESFAAITNVSIRTLHAWVEAYEEFYEARHIADAKGLSYWEEMGQTMGLGQLRRVSKEIYARDDKGDILFRDGKPIIESRSYAHVRGDSKVWQMVMRARFSRFYKQEISVKVKSGSMDPEDMSTEEIEAAIEALRQNKPR